MRMLPDQEKYEQIRAECEQIINKVEDIVANLKKVFANDLNELPSYLAELEEQPFHRIRSKIRSGLINIAVCGAFSSGKSFLISGLIKRLTWIRKSHEEVGDFDNLDDYISFLPSSPEQTSSCPLAVVPSSIPDAPSRLEILFNDTKIWEDVSGSHPNEDQIRAKMRGYVSSLQDSRSIRPKQDWARFVVSARLYVSNLFLPAIIYDLPGIGGAGEQFGGSGEYYTKLVHDYLHQADCIVYVASAVKELSDVELELLSVVEDFSKKNRCPVFFILSQIDREKGWKRVRDKNNQFLNEYFRRDSKANTEFIGQGFVGVSPAVEAKAFGLFQNEEINEEQFNLRIKESGMPSFRQMLTNHLTNVSGPVHLREIAFQVHNILKRVRLAVSDEIQIKSIPIKEAQSRINEYGDLIEALIEKKKLVISDLNELGKQAFSATFSSTDSDVLLKTLRETLEPLIKKSDLLKSTEIHKIEQELKDTVDKWLCRADGGFEIAWERASQNYQMQANRLLTRRLNEAIEEASMPPDNLLGWIRHPKFNSSEGSVIKLGDTLTQVGTAWQAWVGITGISVGSLSSIFASVSGAATTLGPLAAVGSAVAALAPASMFLIVAGALSFVWSNSKKSKERDKLKKQINDEFLPRYADQIVKELEKQVREAIKAYEGVIIKIVDDLIAAQERACVELESKLRSPEHRELQDKLTAMSDLEKQCEIIEERIESFYAEVAPMITLKD